MEGMKIEKLILTEDDLKKYGILDNYDFLRKQLYKAEDRRESVIIQGAAFVVKGKAFLIMGVGGIDFLDSLARLGEVDGIIGNGNALFLSPDFTRVYSAHSTEELIKCYELEGYESKISFFLEEAPIEPSIFLLRSFRDLDEYNSAKKKVGEKVVFEVANTFAREPIRFAGSSKSRLRGKFVAVARVVHCARRPTLLRKECLFDSKESISKVINNFKGHFTLVYTLWNQVLCDVIGMRNTRALPGNFNQVDLITPNLVKIARRFI